MMRPTPTLGLAIIARDEEAALPRLLSSIHGAFDEVALVDTGSEDHTVRVFEDWANAAQQATSSVAHFQWRDNFAAARNFADAQLTTDWLCWADCDDEIHSAARLREIVASQPGDVVALCAGYQCAPYYWWCERLVRKDHGMWTGRVHEQKAVAGRIRPIHPDVVEWIHHVPSDEDGLGSILRNSRILAEWLADEPADPHALVCAAEQSASNGYNAEALDMLYRALEHQANYPGRYPTRAQLCAYVATEHLALGELAEAQRFAELAHRLNPASPIPIHTAAQISYQNGDYALAEARAQQALDLHTDPRFTPVLREGVHCREHESFTALRDAAGLRAVGAAGAPWKP